MTKAILTIFPAFVLLLAATESYARKPVFPPVVRTPNNITVHQTAPMIFGTFTSFGNGGSITIDAGSGARTLSGSISVLSGGNYGQAEFIISGSPGAEIMVSPPASTTLNNASGSDMTISNFKVSPSETITLNQQGVARIKIGASLKVPGRPTQGAYNGYFNVTAHYMR